jgi:uncharacterized small protein (DUF1192 family)
MSTEQMTNAMKPEDRQRDFNLRCHPELATVYDVNWLIARVDRLTEEVEKWKGIASRIDDGLETLKENTDTEVARLTEENARLKAQVGGEDDE